MVKLKTLKVPCNFCNRKVNDDIESKLKHMYEYHPLELAKRAIQNLPVLQRASISFGERVRRAMNHGS